MIGCRDIFGYIERLSELLFPAVAYVEILFLDLGY